METAGRGETSSPSSGSSSTAAGSGSSNNNNNNGGNSSYRTSYGHPGHHRASGLFRHQSMIHHTSSSLSPALSPGHSLKRDRCSISNTSLYRDYRGNPYDLVYNATTGTSADIGHPILPSPHQHHLTPHRTHHLTTSSSIRRRSDPATSVIAAVLRQHDAKVAAMSIDDQEDEDSNDFMIDVVRDRAGGVHDVPIDVDDEEDDCQPLDFSTKKCKESHHEQDQEGRSTVRQPLIPAPVRPSVITCVPSRNINHNNGRNVFAGHSHPDHDRNISSRNADSDDDDDDPMSPSESKLMIDTASPSGGRDQNGHALASSSSIFRKTGCSAMDAVSSDCSSGLSDGASRLKIHQQVSSPDDEEAFDPVTEHFKRSLGREYSDLIRSKSSPLSSSGAGTGTRASSSLSSPSSCGPLTPPASLGKVPLPGTASASSSVLVHNPNSSSNGNNDSCSGSNGATGPLVTTFTSVKVDVDDHFAKALGDQWKKLKAGNSGSKAAAAPASTITSKLGSQV